MSTKAQPPLSVSQRVLEQIRAQGGMTIFCGQLNTLIRKRQGGNARCVWPNVIYRWLREGSQVPADRVLLLESALGKEISRVELRPDIFTEVGGWSEEPSEPHT